MQRIAEQDEQREPPGTFEHRRRYPHMERPVAARGDAERESRQQQEQARGETALEGPDLIPRAHAVLRRQQRADRVAVQHEDHRQRAGEVDEDDAVCVSGGRRGRLDQCVIAWSSTLTPSAYPSGENWKKKPGSSPSRSQESATSVLCVMTTMMRPPLSLTARRCAT